MILDWLSREGGYIFSWWLLMALAGIGVMPLCFRLLHGLPSRGYALARSAGLMLVGFVFWLLNIFGLLRNTAGSMALAWGVVLCISVALVMTWKERDSFRAWVRANATTIILTELLFVLLFVGWALYRAHTPELVGTEKPMEMAFLSAARRSDLFPPHDPWMSGFAISYYHFGYILIAALATLSNVSNGVAFNLALPLLFALTGIGAFGIVSDLVRLRATTTNAADPVQTQTAIWRSSAAGLLATFFIVVSGNFGMAMIEVPWQAGLLPKESAYVAAIDLRFRPADQSDCAPRTQLGPDKSPLDPSNWCYYWWWGYSRVVQDRNLNGSAEEIITEFPQFSFILSDMHPHVLALPFTLLVIGLGLNLVALQRRPLWWEVLFYAIWVGGMVFLNSWDAVYLILFIGFEVLRRLIRNGTGWFANDEWRGIGIFAAGLVGFTALFYAPFFVSFRSQAGGILPNVVWPTRFPQLVVMFGAFLTILGCYLWVERRRAGIRMNWAFARQVFGFILILLAAVLVGSIALAASRPEIWDIAVRSVSQSGGIAAVLADVLRRRLEALPTLLILLAALFLIIARLFGRVTTPSADAAADQPEAPRAIINYSVSTGVVLLLVAAGASLVLIPEFVYLRDGFGTRINMIFKLWYQAWTLWSIAAAYAAWSILSEVDPVEAKNAVRLPFRAVFAVLLSFFIVAGTLYPMAAIYTRALSENGRLRTAQNLPDGTIYAPLSLDGGPSMAMSGDDYAAIQCLSRVATKDSDVVAEATRRGLAYNKAFGRVSALTGIPTLLGWDNHEGQWRGSTFDDALFSDLNGRTTESRADAIRRLYSTTDWAELLEITKRYGITYIYVGPTERNEQQSGIPLFDVAGIEKFSALQPVCQSGDAAVYAVDSIAALAGQAQR